MVTFADAILKIALRSRALYRGYYSNKDEDICLGPIAPLLPVLEIVEQLDNKYTDLCSIETSIANDAISVEDGEEQITIINEEIFEAQAFIISKLIEYACRLGYQFNDILTYGTERQIQVPNDVPYRHMVGRLLYNNWAYHCGERTVDHYKTDNYETIYIFWMVTQTMSIEYLKLSSEAIITQYVNNLEDN